MQVFDDSCVVSYWIDTLVLKLREIITLLSCITLSSSREKPTQAQEVAVLSEALRERVHHYRHHAVVLSELIY